MNLTQKGQIIYDLLSLRYINPTTALIYKTPWQLLVAVILSAQCTDVLVNKVTKDFFIKYPSFQEILISDIESIKNDLKMVNYYNTKALNIYKTARLISERNGEVPLQMDELLLLHGVGRKVANVVINELSPNPQGIVVDTHVKRLSMRLGLTTNVDPFKIEKDLMGLIDKSKWSKFSHLLILHGRSICKARKPICEQCPLIEICPSANL